MTDLHAYESSSTGVPPSYLRVTLPETDPLKHPLVGLSRLIGEQNLRADVLVCCGDLGDRANPEGIQWAWKWVHKLGDEVGARRVLATSGNHDLDSRYAHNKFDARGVLQSLVPPYPLADVGANDRYWSRNFVVEVVDDSRFVVLNSSAYHGAGSCESKEWSHGRVSESTIAGLRTALAAPGSIGVSIRANVLVCHHHPFRFGDIDLADYSEMSGGEALMDVLGSGTFGRWLVIHGHRHWPHLAYGPGSGTSPVVFAAGSLGAVLYPELATRVRNQFYVIDLPTDRYQALGLGLAGEFRAWDWIVNKGWQPAQVGSGVPHRGGFGNRGGGDVAAGKVADILSASGAEYLTWDRVCNDTPALRYLLPEDVDLCERTLKLDYGVEMLKEDGFPVQIGVQS